MKHRVSGVFWLSVIILYVYWSIVLLFQIFVVEDTPTANQCFHRGIPLDGGKLWAPLTAHMYWTNGGAAGSWYWVKDRVVGFLLF